MTAAPLGPSARFHELQGPTRRSSWTQSWLRTCSPLARATRWYEAECSTSQLLAEALQLTVIQFSKNVRTAPLGAGLDVSSAGGAERDRTDDLRLAKPALSQLSYSPVDDGVLDSEQQRSAVGQGRVELPTSRLSGVRSNHLSYWPGPLARASARRVARPFKTETYVWRRLTFRSASIGRHP